MRLDEKATRQEHLSDLADWMNIQINIWAREYKAHHSPDDKLKLAVYEASLGLLKGYVDSFTKDIPVEAGEPKIVRERLGDVDTRYNHLVTLVEMWRDAVELMKEHYVVGTHTIAGETFYEYDQHEKVEPTLILKIVPTADVKKIRLFEKTIEIVEIYQESLVGEFELPGVSKTYPSFKDGAGRLLKPVCEEAFKLGVAANKKRLLDAANEKTQIEEEEQGQGSVAAGQVPSKDEDEFKPVPHPPENENGNQDDEPGFAVT